MSDIAKEKWKNERNLQAQVTYVEFGFTPRYKSGIVPFQMIPFLSGNRNSVSAFTPARTIYGCLTFNLLATVKSAGRENAAHFSHAQSIVGKVYLTTSIYDILLC